MNNQVALHSLCQFLFFKFLCWLKQDELLWAAAWLYKATNNQYYLSYLGKNGDAFGGTGWDMTEFSWDVKYAGVQTLVAKVIFLLLLIILFIQI